MQWCVHYVDACYAMPWCIPDDTHSLTWYISGPYLSPTHARVCLCSWVVQLGLTWLLSYTRSVHAHVHARYNTTVAVRSRIRIHTHRHTYIQNTTCTYTCTQEINLKDMTMSQHIRKKRTETSDGRTEEVRTWPVYICTCTCLSNLHVTNAHICISIKICTERARLVHVPIFLCVCEVCIVMHGLATTLVRACSWVVL